MTIIAHISDLHLLEDSWTTRDFAERARLYQLSFGRRLDARERRMRVLQALAKAHEHGFHHLVVTGDLTEDGHPSQFEVLAELLDESGIAPHRITLIPGNHDLYHQADAWSRAMAGPLAPYAPMSQIDRLLTFEGVSILPLCTAVHQTPLRSAGWVSRESLGHLERLLEDASLSRQPYVVAMHHSPQAYALRSHQWIDGLQDAESVWSILASAPNAFVIHGHTHRALDRAIRCGGTAHVFSCSATVEAPEAVRFYEVHGGVLPIVNADDGRARFGTVRAAVALAS